MFPICEVSLVCSSGPEDETTLLHAAAAVLAHAALSACCSPIAGAQPDWLAANLRITFVDVIVLLHRQLVSQNWKLTLFCLYVLGRKLCLTIL